MSSLPSRGEFIAIVAMLFASIAFSIDAMLPAFPELTAQFSPDDPNRVPLIVTMAVAAFVALRHLAAPPWAVVAAAGALGGALL